MQEGDKSGIINSANYFKTGVADLYYIWKLNIGVYSCITPDIATNEVVITAERIQHIKERHPGDFEKIEPFLQTILNEPDYILEDKKPNTGLVLKKIDRAGMRFQVVLRIHTLNDPKGFKNSIISAWEISENRWENYLRNKNVLYKQE